MLTTLAADRLTQSHGCRSKGAPCGRGEGCSIAIVLLLSCYEEIAGRLSFRNAIGVNKVVAIVYTIGRSNNKASRHAYVSGYFAICLGRLAVPEPKPFFLSTGQTSTSSHPLPLAFALTLAVLLPPPLLFFLVAWYFSTCSSSLCQLLACSASFPDRTKAYLRRFSPEPHRKSKLL